MLGLDISHKILRMDTVYDFLNDLYNDDRGNFRETATKKLVGEIVLTRYRLDIHVLHFESSFQSY